MTKKTLLTMLLLAALLPGELVWAQRGPATATAPTSARARRAVVVPPGFKVISANRRSLLLEVADEEWVREAMDRSKPTSMPSTMPSNVLERAKTVRKELITQIATDLAISDPNKVEGFLAQQLEPMLKKLDEVNPSLIYFVSTQQRVTDLVRAGWTDPRFRMTTSNLLSMNTDLNIDTTDDLLLPAFYNAADPKEKRAETLINAVRSTEAGIAGEVSASAMNGSQAGLAVLVVNEALPGIQVKTGQAWFIIGLANVQAVKYVGILTGASTESVLKVLSSENPNNPFRFNTIDLQNPANETDLRPDARPVYADAMRRKASRAVDHLLTKAPAGSLPKLLVEMRKSMPADGEGLNKLIQEITGVDVTPDLKP